MAMETRRKQLQQKLKQELESRSKTPLTNSQAFEAYFNLSGFLKTLYKMRKEAKYGTV